MPLPNPASGASDYGPVEKDPTFPKVIGHNVLPLGALKAMYADNFFEAGTDILERPAVRGLEGSRDVHPLTEIESVDAIINAMQVNDGPMSLGDLGTKEIAGDKHCYEFFGTYDPEIDTIFLEVEDPNRVGSFSGMVSERVRSAILSLTQYDVNVFFVNKFPKPGQQEPVWGQTLGYGSGDTRNFPRKG